jgi:hypothetical protein
MRRRLTRAELVDRLAPGLRPKLRRDQLRDLALVHVQNLDAVATGNAEPSLLWDYVESTLLWLRVAQLVRAGEAEMQQQCEMVTRLIDRWKATGRVDFAEDIEQARDGVVVMDQLALLADRKQAVEAALWSEIEVAKTRAKEPQL